MITLNKELLQAVSYCLSADKGSWYIQGVNVFDREGKRYYVATNGHILAELVEKLENNEEKIEKPMIIKIFPKQFKNRMPERVPLEIINSKTCLINGEIACEIIDGTYPDYEKLLPDDNVEKPQFYTMFDPKYVKILKEVFRCYVDMPRIASPSSPAMWEKEYPSYRQRVVLMPLNVR